MSRKLRPNDENLRAKKEWVYRAGGWAQFILQLFALKIPGLATNYKLVLISIMDRIRPKGQGGAFPTLEKIAENAGVERTTVWRALKFWKTKGVLAWQGGRGVFWSNEYTLRMSPLMLRLTQIREKCFKLQPTNVANCNIVMFQTATLTSTEVVTGIKGNSTPAEPGTRLTGYDQLTSSNSSDGGFDMASGGGWGTRRSDTGSEKAMDKAESEVKRKGYYRKAKQAEEAWVYMIDKAQERMGLELPPLRGWEGQKIGELIESAGYGMARVKGMIDTLTLNWAGAKKGLRIKDDAPSWNTLVFYAQQLVTRKGEAFGAAAAQIDPDLEEKAKHAKFGEVV